MPLYVKSFFAHSEKVWGFMEPKKFSAVGPPTKLLAGTAVCTVYMTQKKGGTPLKKKGGSPFVSK
jgi:hypothetical protein